MNTFDFIIDLFCRDVRRILSRAVDDQMQSLTKHTQAKLYPSEVVTLGMLFTLKGVGERAFYRWLVRDYLKLFPQWPERTRLFRLFKTHQDWTETFGERSVESQFLAASTVLGAADSYGIELIHPIREGRSARQIGKKGKSNHRWIVGGKLCLLLNQWGSVSGWDAATANVHASTFQSLIRAFEEWMIVLADHGFYAKTGNPTNLKICPCGQWNERMMVETIFSMLTVVCHFKQVMHRVWDYFQARIALMMATFNLLVQWHGLKPDKHGLIHLLIAQFSL